VTEPSKITKEWFADKPVQVPGQMELGAERLIAMEDLEPGDDVEIDLQSGEVKKVTKPESRPLTAAEIVARKLRGAK
jgi:hypothetical protein